MKFFVSVLMLLFWQVATVEVATADQRNVPRIKVAPPGVGMKGLSSRVVPHLPAIHDRLRKFQPGALDAGRKIWNQERNRKCSGSSGVANSTAQYCQ